MIQAVLRSVVVLLLVTSHAAAAPCGPSVPAAACAKQAGLQSCTAHAKERVGEWRYALIAPLYTPVQDVTSAQLAEAWKTGQLAPARRGDKPIALAASPETIAALTLLLGPGKLEPVTEPQPVIDDRHWAIVPAHQLVPAWRAIAIDGVHPLDKAPGALAVPLCVPGATASSPRVRNIDPAHVTTIAVTGTTAPTRMMSKLMDAKGVTYPLRDIQPWLDTVDFVHVSQEIPIMSTCVPPERGGRKFCARDKDIKLLEAAHVKIVELTGGHIVDYGADAVTRTIQLYKQRGWVHFGGGLDQIDATAPRFFEHNGNKFAFLGCNMAWTTGKRIRDGAAVGACDLDRMIRAMREMRVHNVVPLVSIQHEEINEYIPHPSNVRDFQRLAEGGAAFVHGSQAHVAQPWDVHFGAYLHYGAGNFLFDQSYPKLQDGVANKLYLHEGKLLAVAQLYTRLEEHGKPRLLTLAERAGLLAKLVPAHRALARTKPWAKLGPYQLTRELPDSFLVARELHYLTVKVPLLVEPGKKYPLVLDLNGTGAADDAAYVVTSRKGRKKVTLVDAATKFLLAKYPIDASRVKVAGKR